MSAHKLRGLYAITGVDLQGDSLTEAVAAVLRGGAAVVQYRDKSRDARKRLDEASQLRTLCAAAGALFIVNDDIELADRCGADGVHLGRDDGTITEARSVLGPGRIIGASCYDSLQLARQACAAGADYLAFGAFFPSPTKPQAVPASIATLTEAKRELGLPVCAIGGINASNGAQLIAAGADMLAVVSAVFETPDPERAARTIAGIIES